MKFTPPSGVVSFLFTDIEGSTRRWDTDAAAMKSALESHASFPEIGAAIAHLREVLGDEVYEAQGQAGANMSNAAKATYALDRIDEARELLIGGRSRDEQP